MTISINYFSELGVVANVAACSMMFVIVVGTYGDALMYEPKPKVVKLVPCSMDIKDMARKLNVTLMGKCEIYE